MHTPKSQRSNVINKSYQLFNITSDAKNLSPLAVFAIIQQHYPHAALLESATSQAQSRFSFIGIQPYAQVKTSKNLTYKTVNGLTTLHQDHPFTVLRTLTNPIVNIDTSFPSTHAIGFISYDAVRFFEDIPDRHVSDDLPELFFTFYKTTLSFDHSTKTIMVSTLADSDVAAEEELNTIITQIKSVSDFKTLQFNTSLPNQYQDNTDLSDEQFMLMVEKAKRHIEAGDVFQVVLSRCFREKYTVSPFVIYQALCQISPAPYMFYLPLNDRVIVGASPERLIQVENGNISINPIAGTRRRDSTLSEKHIEDDLLNDKKEIAEHMMLVDLARNDLGAVSIPGSINIVELLKVKHYSHISHITSLITGKMQPHYDAFNALAYAFPAGTLSGAPKIRAMEIIDELETSRRGLYGGAVCRLDHQGNLDTCIAIRMAVLKDGVATIRTGAGIVFDSNPEAEANETKHKARNMLESIRIAHQGVMI